MSQQLINEHCSVFSEDNKSICRYQPAIKDENEPNKKLRFNKSSGLNLTVKFNLIILIVILNFLIIKLGYY